MPVAVGTAEWPGDEPFSCGWTGRIGEAGSDANVGWVRTSPHVGTHVDAPYHFDPRGHRVDGFDLEAFVGPCVVVDAVGRETLGVDLFHGIDLRAAPRVLVRTQRRRDPTRFLDAFPVLTEEAARFLGREGVRLFGVDAPSVDAKDAKGLPIHHALARAGIANVENLVLDRADPGRY